VLIAQRTWALLVLTSKSIARETRDRACPYVHSCILQFWGLWLIMQSRFTIATNCQTLKCCINVSYVFCKSYSRKQQEALNQVVTEDCYGALSYMPLYTFLRNFLNILAQIANIMKLQKKSHERSFFCFSLLYYIFCDKR
jgi:hypothetical protein